MLSILDEFGIYGISYFRLHKLVSNRDQITKRELAIVLRFLKLFGAIDIIHNGDDRHKLVCLTGRMSKHFMSSLSQYVLKEHRLISDWDTVGYNPDTNIRNFYRSAEFLYYMESKRIQENRDIKPLREVEVVNTIIKANLIGLNEPVYLYRFDSDAKQYQLIGANNKNKESKKYFMVKKLMQELNENNLVCPGNFDLKQVLKNVKTTSISKTYGIFTEYIISFYHMTTTLDELKLGPYDRWLSVDEVREGLTKDGYIIQNYEFINKNFISEVLEKQPLSIEKIQKNKRFIKANATRKSYNVKLLNAYDFIKMGESVKLEFKSSLRWDYRSKQVNKKLEYAVMKTACAFMNSDGGILVIGVADKGEVVGINEDIKHLHKSDIDGFAQQIYNLASSYLGSDSARYIEVDTEEIDTKNVAVIRISSSDHPVFIKSGEQKEFYIRTGNTSRLLNSEEVYRYIQAHW